MGFTEAITTCLKEKFATFSGRAPRSEYWWFWLFTAIGPTVIWLAVALLSLLIGFIDAATGLIFMGLAGILVCIALLALLIPSLAVAVRRLHDTNHSGWWLLIGLIPFIGALYLIFLYISAGTPGENDYGPDPLAA